MPRHRGARVAAPSSPGPAPGGTLGEFDRIERFLRPLARGFAGALDLRDDAAVFDVPAGCELVVTTDAMVEGIHFLPDDPPGDIAAKLLRVNLSDLAAMGADPLAYSLVTGLPHRIGNDWLAAFVQGLAADQDLFGIGLSGGDSVSTPGPMFLSVTAFGTVPVGGAVRRDGARSGDRVLVTGTIGDAWLGLAVRQGRLSVADPGPLVDRLRRPTPRVRLGPALRRHAHAAADVSDGLVADAGHVAAASGVALRLDASRVPLSDAARAALGADPGLLAGLLGGGDDYELVVAVPPDRSGAFIADAAALGVAVTDIGECVSGPAGAVAVVDGQGRDLPIAARGWSHF